MTRTVFCYKLGRESEGLSFAPWPGPLGQRIFAEISQEAWQQWLAHQTMLINEYRLSPLDPKAKQMLSQEMEKFLFGGEVSRPAGYMPPAADEKA